ncbi:MAG: proton-conducting transporter membrane subunit [Thiohalophilus sp.]|nr:proton-conducting transporter membrane subunit [Thiohalophilus sp.]MDZ7803181.1 proton-conducting transporter membrane subunit [Thiohalophilus sp.]
MEQIIILIAGLPILSALLTQLLGSRMGRRVARLSVLGTLLTFGLAVAALWLVLAGHGPETVSLFGSGALLLLEPLSTLMAVVIAGISLVVHVYSLRYMAEEIGYSRFFVLLDLMTATLLVMVFAGDLLTLLIAWQLVGVLLYFLLGQNTRDVSAYRYAFWTKITYRIGDLPLLIAAVLLYQAYGTGSLPVIFEQISTDPGSAPGTGLAIDGCGRGTHRPGRLRPLGPVSAAYLAALFHVRADAGIGIDARGHR